MVEAGSLPHPANMLLVQGRTLTQLRTIKGKMSARVSGEEDPLPFSQGTSRRELHFLPAPWSEGVEARDEDNPRGEQRREDVRETAWLDLPLRVSAEPADSHVCLSCLLFSSKKVFTDTGHFFRTELHRASKVAASEWLDLAWVGCTVLMRRPFPTKHRLTPYTALAPEWQVLVWQPMSQKIWVLS